MKVDVGILSFSSEEDSNEAVESLESVELFDDIKPVPEDILNMVSDLDYVDRDDIKEEGLDIYSDYINFNFFT